MIVRLNFANFFIIIAGISVFIFYADLILAYFVVLELLCGRGSHVLLFEGFFFKRFYFIGASFLLF